MGVDVFHISKTEHQQNLNQNHILVFLLDIVLFTKDSDAFILHPGKCIYPDMLFSMNIHFHMLILESLFSSSQDHSTMTTYEGFDQWQHPEKNNSLTQVLEGEQISTMAKISASTESQSPWSVDLPLSSALDAKISHPNHQSSYQNTDHTSTHRCQISNGVGTPYPSSRLSSAPPHNFTQLDTIVS